MARLPYGSWPSPDHRRRAGPGGGVGRRAARSTATTSGGASRAPPRAAAPQLVRRTARRRVADVLPDGAWNARTRVHEYGGGAWCVAGGTVFWNDWSDQRLRSLDDGDVAAVEPKLLTPEPAERHALRYADLTATPDGRWIVGVREAHGVPGAEEAVNEIVAVPTDGSAATDPAPVVVLVTGPDFVSSPRIDASGRWLAWTQWTHPDMPWDGTELWAARFDPAGAEVTGAVRVAGGRDESIVQPEWVTGSGGDVAPRLLACSDRSGWWNVHAWEPTVQPIEQPRPIATTQAEIGGPQWVFGERWYAVLPDGVLVAAATSKGTDALVVIGSGRKGTGAPRPAVHLLQPGRRHRTRRGRCGRRRPGHGAGARAPALRRRSGRRRGHRAPPAAGPWLRAGVVQRPRADRLPDHRRRRCARPALPAPQPAGHRVPGEECRRTS